MMKILTKTILAVLATSALSMGANAALYNSTGMTGQPYVGVKAGQFNVDLDNVDTDNATAYGVYAGYKFDPAWGVEAEYVDSDKADATFKTVAGTKVDGEYDAKTYGLYGTYNYNFPASPLYVKGKLGIAKTEIEATAKVLNSQYKSSSDDTSLAGGLGLGYNISPNVGLEAAYDYTNGDSNLWTIGAHAKF